MKSGRQRVPVGAVRTYRCDGSLVRQLGAIFHHPFRLHSHESLHPSVGLYPTSRFLYEFAAVFLHYL